jgi:transcriptional regulator with XRE-family HTH domain
LKAAKGWESDYRVAKELRIAQPTMSAYRNGRSIPDPDVCAKVAELLGIDPMTVIAAAEAERAQRAQNDDAVGRWRARWEKSVAALLVLGIGAAWGYFNPADAMELAASLPMYIMLTLAMVVFGASIRPRIA